MSNSSEPIGPASHPRLTPRKFTLRSKKPVKDTVYKVSWLKYDLNYNGLNELVHFLW